MEALSLVTEQIGIDTELLPGCQPLKRRTDLLCHNHMEQHVRILLLVSYVKQKIMYVYNMDSSF